MRIALAGAGFACAVIARELAEHGHRVEVHERRDHVGGNCHTARDPATGVMLHRYGPHIFHTDDEEVWRYVNRHAVFMPYVHRVKATVRGRVYTLPVNLHTINQFFGRAMSPAEARQWIAARARSGGPPPRNFEEQALAWVGPELYEAFLRGYTHKQWGVPPHRLPAEILRRLPLRFDYDDNYFAHRYQGLPRDGYTALVASILDHPRIEVVLGSALGPAEAGRYDHLFHSGPIDAYYGHPFGALPYRTLDFERIESDGDHQGCAVMNHPDADLPYTRVTEHKHFAPWESHARSVCFRETPRAAEPGDIPYYPVHLAEGNERLARYRALAAADRRVTFVGRLGTFRYLDMDATIRHALDTARAFIAASPHVARPRSEGRASSPVA